jgi:hypothetical protein
MCTAISEGHQGHPSQVDKKWLQERLNDFAQLHLHKLSAAQHITCHFKSRKSTTVSLWANFWQEKVDARYVQCDGSRTV